MKKISDICSAMDIKSNFVDLSLNIIETIEEGNYYIYLAKGLYMNSEVGLNVALKKDLPQGIDLQKNDFSNVFTKEGIKLISIGPESDALLNAMSRLYKVNKNVSFNADLQPFLCGNLNDYPIEYNKGAYRFKIFMERDDLNAELFVNFDFDNQLIFLNEKDINYRKDIIKYLSA